MAAPTVVFNTVNSVAAQLNGADQTITMSGLAIGDLIVMVGGHPFRAGTPIGPVAEANRTWTQRFLDNAVTQAWGIWTCPIDSSNVADTTVQGEGTADAGDPTVYNVHVLRAVDLSNPIAAITSQVATRTPPAIVTPVNDCLVMACASTSATDSAVATLAGYSNQAQTFGNDTQDMSVVTSVKAVAVAGTETPPEYIGLTNTTNKAITLAFRPITVVAGDTDNFFQFL